MLSDFHTHTVCSDGVLIPIELCRRAAVAGYSVLGITDHAGAGGMDRVIEEVTRDREQAEAHYGLRVIVGVELTHVPPREIDSLAHRAKSSGAELVIVHGETLVEPVIEGTNRAALESDYVDILAHPGLITGEEAALAATKGIFLELSARRGHCLSNGHIARVAMSSGARLLINSDAHVPGDILSESMASAVGLGSGLSGHDMAVVIDENPRFLLDRLGLSGLPG